MHDLSFLIFQKYISLVLIGISPRIHMFSGSHVLCFWYFHIFLHIRSGIDTIKCHTRKHDIQESQEVSPFPADDNVAAMNRERTDHLA